MLCQICLRSEQQTRLRRRDMSGFYNICYTDFDELEDANGWLCMFCWTRVSQCIQFITTAQKSKMLLSMKCHSFEPPQLYTYEETCMSTVTLCDDGCQKGIDTIYHQEEDKKIITDVQVKEQTHFVGLKQETNFENIFTVKLECIKIDDINTYTEEYSKDDDSHSHNSDHDDSEDTQYLMEQPQIEDVESWYIYLKTVEEKRRLLGLELVLLTEKEQKKEIFKLRRTVRFETANFKCKMCAITFQTESDVNLHLNMHNENVGEQHKCGICKCHFVSSLQLHKHRSSHERRWRCTKCLAVLGESAVLSRHGYRCRKKVEERYICEVCSKKFINSTSLLYHIRKEHQPQNLQCETCPYKTAIKKHYLRHLLIHRKKETTFACFKCDEPRPTFRALGFLNRHMEKMHNSNRTSDPPEDCYCSLCDKVYKSKKALEVHFKTAKAHLREGYKWECTMCSKKFQTSSNLKLHIQIKHEKPKEYHCPICNKAFSALPYVTKHVNRTHKAPERERPRDFMCDICGSAFKSKCFLKNHVIGKHLKLRPYKCPLCAATFSYNGVLHTHVTQVHKVKYAREFVAASSTRD